MKVVIFSHISDSDGLMPIILSKLAFEEVTYYLTEAGKMDELFLLHLEEMNKYDKIIITDMCISENLYLSLSEKIKNKLFIFDHHLTALNMNKYPFIIVKIEESGKKECATSLYYQYLLDNYYNSYLNKKATSKLVELVRLLDTWEWSINNVKEARWLGEYLNIFKKEMFIEHFYEYIKNNEDFTFSREEQYLFTTQDIQVNNYILEKEKEMISITISGYKTGVVFAESNRSLLGDVLSKKYQDVYDFITIINISRGISYRCIASKDVSKVAQIYGGGGHKNAAGSPIPNDLINFIIKEMFKDAIVEDCNE